MTIRDLRAMIADFPDDAEVTRKVHSYERLPEDFLALNGRFLTIATRTNGSSAGFRLVEDSDVTNPSRIEKICVLEFARG